jgi:ArsR family transcriptional regulator, arsenate/arsenite/antimonite-responsive transcriptional repressor
MNNFLLDGSVANVLMFTETLKRQASFDRYPRNDGCRTDGRLAEAVPMRSSGYVVEHWEGLYVHMSSVQESYKAIADPTRRRILKYLRGGERTAGELAENAGVGRTALSHHLMVLKLADLVRVERRGQFQVYSLNTTVFQDLLTEIVGWLGGMDEGTEDVDRTDGTDGTGSADTADRHN